MSVDFSAYGHGKLLITSEYFVLDGALALALPTKFGQHLKVKQLQADTDLLYWVALDSKHKPWLKAVFGKKNFEILAGESEAAQRLSNCLIQARRLNPAFLNDGFDVAVETQLEFPNDWGLGSSSTFIYALAAWADVDAYTLLQATLGGSGYDVACAGSETAILYVLKNNSPEVQSVEWCPSFKDHLYFAHLGKKKLSSDGIRYYREKLNDKSAAVRRLTEITQSILASDTLSDFSSLVEEHEQLISKELQMERVYDIMFSDFEGSCKSLGAWGGDFVLLTHEGSEETLKGYLSSKNIHTVLSWNEMMYTPQVK